MQITSPVTPCATDGHAWRYGEVRSSAHLRTLLKRIIQTTVITQLPAYRHHLSVSKKKPIASASSRHNQGRVVIRFERVQPDRPGNSPNLTSSWSEFTPDDETENRARNSDSGTVVFDGEFGGLSQIRAPNFPARVSGPQSRSKVKGKVKGSRVANGNNRSQSREFPNGIKIIVSIRAC
jgi:hypothetical protein